VAHHLRPARAASLALAVGASFLIPVIGSQVAQAATHVANPFVGSVPYLNPNYVAEVNAQATADGGSLGSAEASVANYQTAIWMDHIGAITGDSTHLGLQAQLDNAETQSQSSSSPVLVEIVIYDLPGRDCAALASNGEIPATSAGLTEYESQYIDPIVAIEGNSKYSNLRLVNFIEPDSLPNAVTNQSKTACATATPYYEQGIEYALGKLHAIGPQIYNYMDIGHSGWLGWPNNMSGAGPEYAKVVSAAAGGYATVDGFVSDTANTTPSDEPFLPNSNLTVGGQPLKSANFYQWNPYFDEHSYDEAMYNEFVSSGFPSTVGMIIDTSRNGWGGTARPTALNSSPTDVNSYVAANKVDQRPFRGDWCNVNGAGIGARPQANPYGAGDHIIADVWIKPPGESDGDYPTATHPHGDPHCDPNGTQTDGNGGTYPTDAIPGYDIPAGQWFPAQFQQLVQNAYPAIGGTSNGGTTTCSPTGTITAGNYIIQNNEWNSTAQQCVTYTGGTAWNVSTANFNLSTSGAPATYPSIYNGCHWGTCTSNSSFPIQESNLGSVTSSWATTQPASGAYDVAYDIWFNSTPATTGQPDGTEVMVWINSRGGVQPFGSQTGTANIDGMNWNVWTGQQTSWKIISYVLNPGTTSVSNLDLKALFGDAVSRGSINPSNYLIDVEAGFEIWQGGQGLGTTSFSVSATAGNNGGDTTPPSVPANLAVTGTTSSSVSLSWSPSTDNVGVAGYRVYRNGTQVGTTTSTSFTDTGLSASTQYTYTVAAYDAAGNVSAPSAAVSATTSSGNNGGGGCKATYSIGSDWGNGFTANVTVTNTGSSATSSWKVTWTWAGNQQITNMWNANNQQSGQNETATNMSYNGTIAPGANTSFGFQGTYSGTNAAPTLTCTAS
jgi:cellulose 1,4-beta-cellobiosidase